MSTKVGTLKPLSEFQSKVEFVFTDIDDTLTDEGQLGPEAYSALWNLHRKGIHVVPVTGRPAGWCEMIARMWPVSGVIGENGGFYFRYTNKKMKRHFVYDSSTQQANRKKLIAIEKKILRSVKGSAVASDQFSRLMDLAIDFCEDVKPLSKDNVLKIKQLFESSGAIAKISSIHVNGWFGKYDKLTMCKKFLKREFKIDLSQNLDRCAFVGDSPNDEPMFGYFQNSFAVANVKNFLDQIKTPPKFVAAQNGGHGFVEISQAILKNWR